jgi:hypothetical protein
MRRTRARRRAHHQYVYNFRLNQRRQHGQRAPHAPAAVSQPSGRTTGTQRVERSQRRRVDAARGAHRRRSGRDASSR